VKEFPLTLISHCQLYVVVPDVGIVPVAVSACPEIGLISNIDTLIPGAAAAVSVVLTTTVAEFAEVVVSGVLAVSVTLRVKT